MSPGALKTESRSLVKNTVFNLIGLAAPLIIAVLTIPPLLNGLGTEKFGLLTLIWAVVGYFGLLDLGLGRAMTLALAIVESGGNRLRTGQIIGTGISAILAAGVLAGLILYAVADLAVSLVSDLSDPVEAATSVKAVALAVPFIALTSALRGILEARQQFAIVNLIRIPVGIFTFLGPLFVLWSVGPDLVAIAWVLAALRIVATFAHAFWALDTGINYTIVRSELTELFRQGWWLCVANAAGPLMSYVDRFIIAGLLSATAVAYYATPQEIVTKLWIIPGALTAVLFPSFAAQLRTCPGASAETFRNSLIGLTVVLLPISAALGFYSHDILSIWIGPGFADESAPVLTAMSAGIFVNCLAHVPYTLLQSAGRGRTTAMLQIFELPVYVLALTLAAATFGVVGAAWAWSGRILADAFLMFRFAAKVFQEADRNQDRPSSTRRRKY
jgi:O-antigen/teichoic acid export membrane protein